MIPTGRLFWLLGGLVILGAVASIIGLALPAWAALAALIGVALVTDALWLRGVTVPEATRDLPRSVAVGEWTEVTLHLDNAGESGLDLRLFDKPPEVCDFRGLPESASLPAGRELQTTYEMKATERGPFAFEPADLQIRGPLGILRRQVEVGPESEFRVMPNFENVNRFSLLAIADRVGQLGIRQIRRRGQGMEFSHLREYREGDLSRQIDWKATARRQELISREYEDERDQNIVFLLDCGRRMRARDGELSHFDQCLNASLLLTHVALHQGDAIALSTFGGHDIWIPRQKGPRAMDIVMDEVYDLQPTTEPSDFSQAARDIVQRHRRRSLVIILTNLYEQLHDELMEAIRLLRSRHVVLIASLREGVTNELLERDIDGFEDALMTAATHEYLEQRRELHEELTSDDVMLLDVAPADLSIELVNRYIEVKRAGLL